MWHLVVRKLEMGGNGLILCTASVMNDIAKLDALEGLLLLLYILFLNDKLLLSHMSTLICYIFLFLCGQKFLPNHWPSRCFLRQFLITFSSKIDPHKARLDLLYSRGWNR